MTKKLGSYATQKRNANHHKPLGLKMLNDSIAKYGIADGITVAADGESLSGSARLETLAALMPDVKIVEVETSGNTLLVNRRTDIPNADDPRGQALSAAINIVQRVDYEPDGAILAVLADDDKLIRDMIAADDASMAAVLAAANGDGAGDAEPQISRADELQAKWQCKTGDLWQIAEHRLLVGDSTNADDVARVMGDDRAVMVWTDPPYGVAVGDKNKFLNSIAPSNRVEENLENDALDESGLIAMLCAAFDNAIASCTAGAAWYVAAPPGPLHLLFGQVLKDRNIWRQTLQWVKNNSTFSPMGVCYHWQAEPIFFGWLPNGGHRWYGGRKQTTVWAIDRPTASPAHPTMKPVELVARAIGNSSQADEIVLDPFAGSGTTGIACQNLNRKARMVEIDPKYCAVVLERFATAFPGIVIERVE